MLKLSIVTPSYNQAEYIERTIESVLRQRYPNLEHIVMDGESTDGTLEILRRYHHLRWVSERDRGQSHAVNKGLAMSTGDICGWVNSDDTYEPDAFWYVAEQFSRHPEWGMLYGSYNLIDSADRVLRTVTPRDWNLELLIRCRHSYVGSPAVFFRREVYESVGPLDEGLHHAMDYDYWIRVGKRHKVVRVPATLGSFRHHHTAKTHSGDSRLRRERDTIWQRYYTGGRYVGMFFTAYWESRAFLHRRLMESRMARSKLLGEN